MQKRPKGVGVSARPTACFLGLSNTLHLSLLYFAGWIISIFSTARPPLEMHSLGCSSLITFLRSLTHYAIEFLGYNMDDLLTFI